MSAAIAGEPGAVWAGDNRPSLCAVSLVIKRDAAFERTEISFNPMQLAICRGDADGMVVLSTRGHRPAVRRSLAGDQFPVDRTGSRSRLGFHAHVSLAVRCQRNR